MNDQIETPRSLPNCSNESTLCDTHNGALERLQRRQIGSFVTTLKTGMKELRARNNLTQEDLAKKVKVRREIIHVIETGTCNPSLIPASDIAKALDATFMACPSLRE